LKMQSGTGHFDESWKFINTSSKKFMLDFTYTSAHFCFSLLRKVIKKLTKKRENERKDTSRATTVLC